MFVLTKVDDGPYWPHITKTKLKVSSSRCDLYHTHPIQLPWLTTDFDKWKDEDEEDDEPAAAGGMPGMAGMDFGGMDMESVRVYLTCMHTCPSSINR